MNVNVLCATLSLVDQQQQFEGEAVRMVLAVRENDETENRSCVNSTSLPLSMAIVRRRRG